MASDGTVYVISSDTKLYALQDKITYCIKKWSFKFSNIINLYTHIYLSADTIIFN